VRRCDFDVAAQGLQRKAWRIPVCICSEIILMTRLHIGLITGLSLASLAETAPRALAVSAADPDGTPHLLTELQFESPPSTGTTAPGVSASMVSTAINTSGWSFGASNGASISLPTTSSPPSARATADALEGSYPDVAPSPGSNFIWANDSVEKFAP